MTQRVHVAIFDSWADWELGYATAHIRRASWQRSPGRYEVVTVGLTGEPITTMGGLRITPDTTLDEVAPADSAMLLLAGGDTWADGVMQPFRDLARQFVEAGVPVAALCGATFGLALTGLLDERPHTSNDPGYLAMSGYTGGAHYRAEPAVSDGTVITGSGTRPVPRTGRAGPARRLRAERARVLVQALQRRRPGRLLRTHERVSDACGANSVIGRSGAHGISRRWTRAERAVPEEGE